MPSSVALLESNAGCGICAKRFHHTQVAILCIACKKWLHGSCCIPTVKKSSLNQYKETPFVCHVCTERNKAECSTFDGAAPKRRVAPLVAAAARSALPADVAAAVAPAAAAGAAGNVLIRQLLERVERLEQCNERLTAKLSAYEKAIDEFRDNGIFWDKQLEDKSRKIDILLKKLASKQNAARRPGADNLPKSNLFDIVICNVPEIEDENTAGVAQAILSTLEPTLQGDCFSQATRITTSNGNGVPLIKITMNDEHVKGKVIKAAKLKKLCVNDMKLDSKFNVLSKKKDAGNWKGQKPQPDVLARRVFVNESTSKATRQLFNRVRKLRESGLVERAWTFRDNVFVRVTGRDRPLCVRSESDLNNLLQSGDRCNPQCALVKDDPISDSAVIPNVPTSNSFSVLASDDQPMTRQTTENIGADVLSSSVLQSTPRKVPAPIVFAELTRNKPNSAALQACNDSADVLNTAILMGTPRKSRKGK